MELNPKIWDNEEMRPEVRKQLLKIVSAFKKSLSIPIDIADVHVVGSNASYNYTDSSDLDVHIIANFSMLPASPEIAKAVYDSAKSDFNKAYNVSVHGIPVELYVEDIRSTVVSNGKYSILTNKWIKKPDAEIVELPDVAEVASIWEEKAKRAIESDSLDQVKSVVNNLYLIRKNSIDVDGEYGKGNALFKAIRSSGTLDKLKDTIKELQSKDLSLENLREGLLTEESRAQLIQQSKSSKKGLQRYNRRTKSRIATSVQQYNSIDMNKLFKDNTLIVNIQVYGETDNYTVKIRFDGFLDILHRAIDKHNGECNLRVITLALIEAFNKEDVKIHCSCDDAKYRFNFWQTKTDINSGDKQEIPSNITNPDNTLGSACKHVLLVLANNSWLLKVASVVNNYIKYMEKNKQRLYADIIYPAIYGKAYEEPVQIDVFADEEEDELAGEEDTDTVSKAIDFGKKRTQFQKGNLQGVRFAKSSTDPNQITISGEDS